MTSDEWRYTEEEADEWYRYRIYSGDRLVANILSKSASGLDDAARIVNDHNALEAAQAEVARLRAALEWYADEDNYCEDTHAPITRGLLYEEYDLGKRARAALDGTAEAGGE